MEIGRLEAEIRHGRTAAGAFSAVAAALALLALAVGAALVLRHDSGPPTFANPVAETQPPPPLVTTASTTPLARPVSLNILGPPGRHEVVRVALGEARARWDAAKPAHGYTWRYDQLCWCADRTKEVEVDGTGRVTAVRTLTDSGTQESEDITLGFTVEDAFAQLQGAVDQNDYGIGARFDLTLGFPAFVSIDPVPQGADDEYGEAVSAFTPN